MRFGIESVTWNNTDNWAEIVGTSRWFVVRVEVGWWACDDSCKGGPNLCFANHIKVINEKIVYIYINIYSWGWRWQETLMYKEY